MNHNAFVLVLACTIGMAAGRTDARGKSQKKEISLDQQVSAFLESQKNAWRDMNIPETDGKALYDLIVKHGYKRALEIGTSTGHSGVWIAWALSKTGGKLITLEIDEERHREALDHFKKAGVGSIIDARLGDAHDIVPSLDGPFDFVFSDADKEGYKKYAEWLIPKLTVGGCFTAHNVLNGYIGTHELLDYVKSLPNVETTILRSSVSGISLSFKKR